jgi:hypothetical protein
MDVLYEILDHFCDLKVEAIIMKNNSLLIYLRKPINIEIYTFVDNSRYE